MFNILEAGSFREAYTQRLDIDQIFFAPSPFLIIGPAFD
jgi:hypothetical protein